MMKTPKYIYILLLIFFITLPSVLMAETKISLSLDRSEASVNDAVQLSIKIEGGSDGDPVVQGLQDFVVSKGGTSSQIQIINGKISKSNQITYNLQPRSTGVFTIGPANVTASGRAYSSNTARLTVTKQTDAGSNRSSPISISASLSSNTVYPGQQIVYTLKLYRSIRVSDVSVQLPKTKGISFKQLGDSTEYSTTLGGREVMVLEVHYLLSVNKPGEYKLEPATMQMSVYDQTRRSQHDFFNDPFFNSRGRPATVSSNTSSLSVRQFPEEGKPANFSGLVGSFSIKSQLDPAQVKTGDSANLTVEVSGSGNVNLIPDLTISDIEGLKIYADQPKLNSETTSSGESGTKTMKWAIVPQKTGVYELPQLNLSYFDTDSGRYKELTSPQLRLTVSQGASQTSQTPSAIKPGALAALPKTEVEELGKDILPIHASVKDLNAGVNILDNLLLTVIILLIPLILWLTVLIVLKRRHWDLKYAGVIKARKAAVTLCSTLVKQHLNANQTIEAVRTYFNDRFGLAVGLITPEEAKTVLIKQGVSEGLIGELYKILTDLQLSVYTGGGDVPAKIDIDLPQLIRRIDREAK